MIQTAAILSTGDEELFGSDFFRGLLPAEPPLVATTLEGFSPEDVERFTWRNAAELFRHDVPASVRADPNAY